MESTKASRRLEKVYNVPRQTNVEEMIISWKIPGFLPSSFDRRGKPYAWAALKNLEVLRGHQPVSEQNTAWMRVVVALRVTFSRHFFGAVAMDFLMVGSYRLIQVGKSSVVSLLQLTEDMPVTESEKMNDVKPLVEVVRFYAVIDKQTRRSTQLPEEDVLKYKAQCRSPISSLSPNITQRVSVQPKPEIGCYTCMMKAAHSDLDHLNHVNGAVFLRFALDGIDAAIMAGALTQNFKDSDRDVRKIEAQNLREVFAGSELLVHVWVPDNSGNVINCQLDCDGLAAFRCSVEYY